MAEYNGDKFLISVGDGGGTEVFTVVACMKSTSLSINNEQIDVTSKCSTPWRKLLGGGVRSMSLSLSGVFTDDVSMQTMIAKANAGEISNYRVTSQHGDQYEGAFQCVTMERSGEYQDAEQYSLTLESSDIIAYTPAP